MKPKILINYTDFWQGFNVADNYFQHLLSQQYDLVLSEKPDILIYSVFGKEHLKYKCKRILFSGENIGANFTECDYAFTGDHNPDPRHYRLPFYAFCYPPERFVKPETDVKQCSEAKEKFCCFVVSNPHGKIRNQFFAHLSRYKKIDSGGKFLNSIGYRVPDKESFIANYKFCMAFENRSYPGYTTEKLVEPMFMNTIPIYWGNPLVHLDFNPEAFLNYHSFGSSDSFIKRIIEVDNNPELYMSYLQAPWCYGNRLKDAFQPEKVLARFIYIIETPITPVAQKPKTLSHYINNNLFRLKKNIRRGYI